MTNKNKPQRDPVEVKRQRAEYQRRWRAQHPEYNVRYLEKMKRLDPARWAERKRKDAEASRCYRENMQRADPEWRQRNVDYQRRYRLQFPEKQDEYQRRYRATHPHAKAASIKRWHAQHPLRNRNYTGRYRAKKAGVPPDRIEQVDLGEVVQAADGRCGLCHQPIAPGEPMEFDHIVPIASGGSHTLSNLQLAHVRCNRRRR